MIRATIGILAGTGRKPVALAATGVGETSFTANWEAFEDAVYYLLDVSTQEDFSTFVYENEVINAPTTSYVVIGLEDDTTYYYRLRASTEPLYLLDEWEYPYASAAYSLRKLRHEYKGAAVEVRNDSGVHLDIGFDESGDLDTTALLAHCGSGSGTVSTWYDQSGNGHDFEQSVVANQPQIVNSGVYLNSINLDLVDDYMVASSNYTPSSYQSIFTVFEKGVNTSGQLPLLANNNLNDNGVLYSNSINFAYWPVRRQGYLRNINYPISFNLYSFFKTGDGNASDVLEAYVNSNSSGTPQGTSTGNAGVLNYLNRSSTPDDKKIKEIIIYSSDQSSNRSGIETNINQRYNIYFDGSYTPLLDTYSGSAAAYSLRLLNSSYTGPLIEVRNDSGVHADIGFTYDGKLNEEALLAHCGSGNGTVSTWYDQSGSGNDATQSNVANQPQIVSSGSVITENGKPAVQFDGTDDYLINTSQEFITISFVTKITVDTANMIVGDETDPLYNIWYSSTTLSFDGGESDEARYSINGSALSSYAENHTISNYLNSQINLFANYDTSRSMSSKFINIGRYNSSLLFNGVIQELVFYNSDQSSNRTGIETNINAQYQIYWDGSQTSLLDTYSGSAAAYSLRALNSAYTGPLVEVRNDSGVHADIYAKYDGSLNTDALLAHCGSGNGTVSTWYDQSGNGNDATQTNVSEQPQIVSSGSVILENGKPAVYTTASGGKNLNTGLLTLPVSGDIDLDFFAVIAQQSSGNSNHLFGLTDNTGGIDRRKVFCYGIDSATTISVRLYGGATVYDNTTSGQLLFNTNYQGGGGAFDSRINGSSLSVSSFDNTGLNIQTSSGFILMSGSSGVSPNLSYSNPNSKGYLQEVVYYLSDQSSNRTGIETNINSHYNIY